jgi:hypothetical protein
MTTELVLVGGRMDGCLYGQINGWMCWVKPGLGDYLAQSKNMPQVSNYKPKVPRKHN